MKLRIRLQNHGVANHPYWWIVVAPHRKNIRGRFIEHVGYWTPRQGVNVDRQITLNIPRIKYWMGCGAVPTPKIQRFLSYWDILPKPWYPPRSPEELAALRKPESEWTDHDKRKQERKQKRRERLKLSYLNYFKTMAKFKARQTAHFDRHTLKIREKINAAERENQILRELLLHNEFGKINRINELSGRVPTDDSVELLRLEGQLRKAKAELALIDKNTKNFTPLQKTKVITRMNALVDKIRQAEMQRNPFRIRNSSKDKISQNITQYELDRKIEYQLITKKLDNVNKQLENIQKLYETVTLEQFANYLLKHDQTIRYSKRALQLAQQIFIERGRVEMPPLTKYELYYSDEILNDPDQLMDFDRDKEPFIKWQSKKYGKQRVYKTQKAEESSEIAEEAKPQAAIGEIQAKQGQQAPQGEKEVEPAEKIEEIGKKKKFQRDPYLGFATKKQLGIDLTKAQQEIKHVTEKDLLRYLLTRPDVIVPTNRPVHPFPDLQTYVPEEYYEPISNLNLKITSFQSLEPNDVLKKYHIKRDYSLTSSNKAKSTKSKAKPPQQPEPQKVAKTAKADKVATRSDQLV